jgi:hypothetical protein
VGRIAFAPLRVDSSPQKTLFFQKNAGGLHRDYRWSAFLLRQNRKMVFIHY